MLELEKYSIIDMTRNIFIYIGFSIYFKPIFSLKKSIRLISFFLNPRKLTLDTFWEEL